MSDHQEEMREMRLNQADLMSKISELCSQVRELVVELRHTQKDYELTDSRVAKLEQDVRALQLDSALNKPILDIAKSINSKMWLAILGAIVSIAATGIDWSKFMGS